ncbi:hypothetical protein QP519_10475 [Weeksella virosa]|uniref:hypothetical protein n=1 Tax=Weeksella virosa TaxID=1014 RepID=UPI0025528595|nr:hypothetical protein [Weeksella virosa]MDK7375959.1 hypothetical protein [Weeksella virosa]
MKLKLYMRKLQLYDEFQRPVWYSGINPSSLNIVEGYIPNNEWIEFTKHIDNLDELNIVCKARSTENTRSISNIEKSVTNELQLYGNAFKFVKDWLMDHVASPLNGIEVKIELENIGTMTDFVIKSDGLNYCDDDYCTIEVSLKQKDDFYTCIYSTLVTDNHLGMFNGEYKHPRFSYCNEFRPTFLLSLLFQILGVVGIVSIIINLILQIIITPIITVINAIISAVNKIPGVRIKKIKNPIPSVKELINSITDIFIDLFGCGREHPAPLVRDYIRNVCSKCGVRITTESIPFFFNPSSPYYNLTYFSAETKKGVDKESKKYWIEDNDPLLTLDMLLDQLKKPFNAKWYIKGGVLFFDHVDKLDSDDFVFDFIDKDKHLVLDNICYSWNTQKKPAYMRVGYSVDAFDNLTNDCRVRYNDIIEFNKPINPILSGSQDDTLVEFAPTRFRNDGIDTDYVTQTLNPVGKAGKIIGLLLTGPQFLTTLNHVKKEMKHYKGVVLMQNHTTMLPRLIIWDGKDKQAAKAVKSYQYGGVMPSPNDIYNTGGIPYDQTNKAGEQYDEFYKEYNYVINYPMFYDAQYKGNLWDFHQTKDPRFNPVMNKEFELSIQLCAEALHRLNILENSGNVNIERKVKIDAGEYYKEGIIKEIEINFDGRKNKGRYIKIKGTV